MISRKKLRLVLAVVSTGILSIVSASSQAGRSVRSDQSDDAFESFGAFWGSDNEFSGEPGVAGRTEFKLKINPSGDARFFTVCMSEEGFLKLIASNQACADSDYDLPPTGNYIAVFATELESNNGLLRRTRGFVDSSAPYKLWQADPAMRFWWNNVTLVGDDPLDLKTFDVQVVLIDRSDGTNNGNFDIELNYGSPNGERVPPVGTDTNPNAYGFQGFKLGPNTRGPTLGPFGPFQETSAPIRFCFRGGKRQATCN